MTSQSPRIYTYKITFEEVPYYYYGVHKERRFNDYYMGSPKTHKWCWEFYTPKKQILEFFDYSDEGWMKAQEIETRLIKPFYNTDKWCLNESCGGQVSLETRRKSGIKVKQQKIGMFAMSKEERIEISRKAGLTNKENKTGLCGLSFEERSEIGSRGGRTARDKKVGCFALTKDQLSENGKKGGSISGTNHKKNGTGIFAQTPEYRSAHAKKINAQRWMCLETGYVSNAGGLSCYQKFRGIDTSKRIKISNVE